MKMRFVLFAAIGLLAGCDALLEGLDNLSEARDSGPRVVVMTVDIGSDAIDAVQFQSFSLLNVKGERRAFEPEVIAKTTEGVLPANGKIEMTMRADERYFIFSAFSPFDPLLIVGDTKRENFILMTDQSALYRLCDAENQPLLADAVERERPGFAWTEIEYQVLENELGNVARFEYWSGPDSLIWQAGVDVIVIARNDDGDFAQTDPIRLSVWEEVNLATRDETRFCRDDMLPPDAGLGDGSTLPVKAVSAQNALLFDGARIPNFVGTAPLDLAPVAALAEPFREP